MGKRHPQVGLLRSLFLVITSTNGLVKSFRFWKTEMVSTCLAASTEALTEMAASLLTLCERVTAVQANPAAESIITDTFDSRGSLVLELTAAVQSECVGQVVKGVYEKFKGHLLESKSFFKGHVANGQFLPEPEKLTDDPEFWQKCLEVGPQESMVATLKGIAALGATEIDMDDVGTRFVEHQAQFLIVMAFDSVKLFLKSKDLSEARTALVNMESSLLKVKDLMTDKGFTWLGSSKAWVLKNVVTPLIAELDTKVVMKVTDSLNAIPDGIDNLIITKNLARLRQTVFSRETHNATCANIEEFNAIHLSLEKVATTNFLSGSQLAKVRNMGSMLKRLRSYSSTVHALNMLINRFPKKAPRERSALLRKPLPNELIQPWVTFVWGGSGYLTL